MYKRNAGIAAALAAVVVLGYLGAVAASGRPSHRALAVEVHVTVTDRSLSIAPANLRSQFASFEVALIIANKGKKPHIVTIKGPGLSGPPTKSGARAQRVAPGTTTTLRLKLVTGAYQLSDPRGLAAGTERWLLVRPTTVEGGKTRSSTVTNPAFAPGVTSTNSGQFCDI